MSLRPVLKRTRWLALVAGWLLASACDDTVPSVYTARAYEPAGNCLDDYSSVGLVDNARLSALCPPTCLQVGADLYVSTVCGPYPDEATVVLPMDSQDCVAALPLITKPSCGAK